MEERRDFARVLAIMGTILAWLPIVAPLVLGVLALPRSGRFLLDYLMPAELGLVALAGGWLLLWAAVRARACRALIATALGVGIAALIGTQQVAVVTGLATGEIEPAGWPWTLVVALLALYTLAVIALGVGGILLLRDLYRRNRLIPRQL